jgi:hypothetical protein
LGHFLAVDAAQFARVRMTTGSLVRAIDVLNVEGRLAPVAVGPPSLWEEFVSGCRLGDPGSVAESWRWRVRGQRR